MFKFIAGILGKSAAMVSDSIHSASDVFTTVIVMIAVKIASKNADKEHPYGHERIESMATLLLAIILGFVGIAMAWEATLDIIQDHIVAINDAPIYLALIAAIISIVVKEAMYQYTKKYAKQIHSDALMADAWHHRSDSLSSIGSLIGVAGIMAGYPILDKLACFVICIFILKIAFDLGKDAICKLIDHACSEEMVENIKQNILKNAKVLGIFSMKSRLFGNRVYLDVTILENKDITLEESYQVAREVHDMVEENFPEVKHCNVLVKPE